MYSDKQMICKDCGKSFTFSARDQQFYAEREFQAPLRCKTCREARKNGARPRKATVEELIQYRKMPCAYENAIRRIAETIVSDYAASPSDTVGWILSRTYNKYTNPRDPKVSEYIIVLSTTGKLLTFFSEYADQNEEYELEGLGAVSGKVQSFDSICEEFDFVSFYKGQYNQGNRTEFIGIENDCTLTRYYDAKGQGLYNKLKEISEKKMEPLVIERPRPEEYRAKMAHYEELSKQKASQKSSEGCYVATCVYGSYDCSQVRVLRKFRDNVLAKTWYGRTFIKIYYAVSPSLVRLFGNTKWFKNLWEPCLDKLVNRMKEE